MCRWGNTWGFAPAQGLFCRGPECEITGNAQCPLLELHVLFFSHKTVFSCPGDIFLLSGGLNHVLIHAHCLLCASALGKQASPYPNPTGDLICSILHGANPAWKTPSEGQHRPFPRNYSPGQPHHSQPGVPAGLGLLILPPTQQSASCQGDLQNKAMETPSPRNAEPPDSADSNSRSREAANGVNALNAQGTQLLGTQCGSDFWERDVFLVQPCRLQILPRSSRGTFPPLDLLTPA